MTRFLRECIEYTGKTIAWLIYPIALVICVIVVLRYVFHISIILQQELVEYMHALLFMTGLSYTLKHDAHVRVDVLYSKLSDFKKVLINLCGHLLLLIPVVCTIGYFSLEFAWDSWRIFERSEEVRGIPAVYILKTVIPFAFGLLLLQSITDVVGYIKQLKSD